MPPPPAAGWSPDRLLRHAGTDASGVARLGPRTVFILPTAFGYLYTLLVASLLIAAFNYLNNLVMGLSFMLAGMGLVGMVQTWRNLVGLEIRVLEPQPVFAGQIARFPVSLHKTSAGGASLALRLDRGTPTPADLSASASASALCELPARSRGLLKPRRLVIESRYPLGLFRAWSIVVPGSCGLVYPAPLPDSARPSPAGGQGGSEAASHDGDDFAGLRLHRRGEPLHRVDWKAMARSGELHTKVFVSEARTPERIAWDDTPAGDAEIRLSMLTAWVLDAVHENRPFSFHLPDLDIATDQGQAHGERCLRALALHGLSP